MAVVIRTNVDAIKIQHSLTDATNSMSTQMARMSSGLKVLSAKDDAAGTVIAARMKVQLEGNKIAQNNVQNGNAMLATAEGHLDVVLDNVSRIRDLTLQAKNGTYSAEEIKAMQDEVAELIQEVDRISSSSKFSSLHLFEEQKNADGSDPAQSLQKDGATFQVGANPTDDNTILADKKLFGSVQFSTLTTFTGTFDLTKMTKEDMADAIAKLDIGIDNVTDRKSIIGSAQNRLESALNTLTTQYENLSSAKSIITDADIAEESSKYTQDSILQQVATSLLAQANQAPAVALSLI